MRFFLAEKQSCRMLGTHLIMWEGKKVEKEGKSHQSELIWQLIPKQMTSVMSTDCVGV